MAGKLNWYGLSLNGIRRRHFSSSSQSSTANHQLFFVCNNHEEVQNASFPNSKDFPLPGQALSSYQYRLNCYVTERQVKAWQEVSDTVLSTKLAKERQINALQQFVSPKPRVEPISHDKENRLLDDVCNENTSLSLAATAQTCPEILKREFSDLFPEFNSPTSAYTKNDRSPSSSILGTHGFSSLSGSNEITVMNIVQQTYNDMAYWSKNMEMEREKLTSDFINIASTLCESLQKAGYWANFIDPSTGRPYMGPFTSATLFETDDRYRYFGFQIDDLGCCKIVKHPDWGTKAFTGTIFTSAPRHSPRMCSLLSRINTAAAGRMKENHAVSTASTSASPSAIKAVANDLSTDPTARLRHPSTPTHKSSAASNPQTSSASPSDSLESDTNQIESSVGRKKLRNKV